MRPRGKLAGAPVTAVVATLLTFLLAWPPHAHAQSRDKKAASAHFQHASQLYAAERFDEALVEFQAGYAAFPLPGFLVNIGQCYRKLDRLSQAAESFKQFLDAAGPENKLRREVEDAYAEVKSELERRTQAEAKRRREAEEQRQALLRSIASQPAQAAPSPAVVEATPAAEVRTEPRKRSRKWVWAIVGVLAAGAAASAVAVGVLYGQPHAPQPGSLGLLDGRRP